MSGMQSVTVDRLVQDFPGVEKLLRESGPVQITRHGEVIAQLISENKPKPKYEPGTAPLPDFMGRLRKIYGDKVLEIPGSEIVREGRDR